MNTKDFLRLGVPLGEATRRATDFVAKFILGGGDKSRLHGEVAAIVANPSAFVDDPLRSEFAKAILKAPPPPRAEPVKYRQWGEGLEHDAVMQMERACLLPVSVAGALMPDAHVGYGLPIGGVLATGNAVIPYAVGVDIACRMKMTVLDIPVRDLEQKQDRLTRAIEAETRFGVGATFRDRRAHEVFDADWTISPVTKQNKDRAWSQLGTSGSGNHFVEFGLFTAHSKINDLDPGTYVALLSHSGSRGTGAAVCDYYSKIAFAQFPDLPSELKRLAWLSLDSQEGQEYWNAMELMGRYAAANHACIHQQLADNLGAQVLLDLENHHNFAWKENHVIEGVEREVIVHRKGATPAGDGVLGIIPGSMASPGFVVSGKGNPDSLNSASHGAGRAMSRKAANEKFNWKDVNRFLRERGVTLISAGLDEVPMAYKNIREVMAAQNDLVTVLGRFDPKLVKMAPSGERPEETEQMRTIIPDVLPPATVDNLIHAIEIALGNRTDSSEYAVRHLHQKVPAVRRLANGAMVRALVNSVLGPDAFVVRSIFFDKTPEANWKVAWHQDLTIAVRERIEVPGFAAWSIKDAIVHVQPPVSVLERMVTLRLHLDDCGPENGPLQVIPKSHKAGRLTGQQISACREREKSIACVVPRGGALLMRPLLLHASSPATAPMHRRVVHLEFACDPLPGGLEWEACV